VAEQRWDRALSRTPGAWAIALLLALKHLDINMLRACSAALLHLLSNPLTHNVLL
jgi:hypothetical protein